LICSIGDGGAYCFRWCIVGGSGAECDGGVCNPNGMPVRVGPIQYSHCP
jgi:hypothetical protein